jgi:HEAT repeat protein
MDGSSAAAEGPVPEQRSALGARHWPQIAAVGAGVLLALFVSGGGAAAVWGKTLGIFSPQEISRHTAKLTDRTSSIADRDLDSQRPQKQAEILLTRAVSRDDRAVHQIQARLDGWRGKIQWDPQLSDLTTVALNSTDPSVRVSSIEVQLAAYGLSKNESSVDALVRQTNSRDHAQKVWALWGLGLLGNRGVQTDRVVQVLSAQLKDSGQTSDEDSRRWAVEGLALVGTSSTIEPLLQAMHDDPSPVVRERAACSLAESGMLSHEQRLIAVPRLINYSSDPALDAQTHAWAFQALADITKQHLPNDSNAWRSWYQTAGGSGQ